MNPMAQQLKYIPNTRNYILTIWNCYRRRFEFLKMIDFLITIYFDRLVRIRQDCKFVILLLLVSCFSAITLVAPFHRDTVDCLFVVKLILYLIQLYFRQLANVIMSCIKCIFDAQSCNKLYFELKMQQYILKMANKTFLMVYFFFIYFNLKHSMLCYLENFPIYAH